MQNPLEELVRKIEEHKAIVEKTVNASERVIGRFQVSLTTAKGIVGARIETDEGGICPTAQEFVRIINWFRKHYGEIPEAPEDGDEKAVGEQT